MVPLREGNEARRDGRRGVGVSHSTAEAGELSPRDPVEGRGHRQAAPLEGKTANTPRLGPVSTSRQRIAELARQALGMAVAIAWLPGPAGTRRRVAKLSVEEPDAAEPARPDLWGARVSNDPGLPDHPATGWSNFPPPPWSNFGPPLTPDNSVSSVAFQTPSPWSGSHLNNLSKFRGPPLNGAQSISTRRAYGLQRICRVWLF